MTRRIVHLLRHGEVYNPDRVLYGRLPGFHLSDRGVEQAELAAKFLGTKDITYIVSSPMERAQETAAPLAQKLGLPVEIDERLTEASNKLQGKRVAGGKGLFSDPANWKLFVNPLRPSWGEPYLQVAQRVEAAMRDACERATESVCVSHQLPIVAARRHLLGRPLPHDPRRRNCALGSVTSFTFIDGTVVRIDYAEPAGGERPGEVAGA